MDKPMIGYDRVFDSQIHFREILDAISRPGTLCTLSLSPLHSPNGPPSGVFYIALALLNADVQFIFLGSDSALAEKFIIEQTSCKTAPLQNADFIFLNGNNASNFMEGCKKGSLLYPEEGASLIIYTEKISLLPFSPSLKIGLIGPGVESQNGVYISGLLGSTLGSLQEINAEFPLGLDLFLVDRQNLLVAIPRSNHFTFQTI